MEYWVILDYDTVIGLVAAPAEWDQIKVLAAWCNPRGAAFVARVVSGDLHAEKWQIETLKE